LRAATKERKTAETNIKVEINLDGSGNHSGSTSIPFLDHMLALMARHGFMDLAVEAQGDTHVDYHHLMEDLGIVLGQAVHDALGDKKGIRRYGHAVTPMDEALAEVTVDLSGRPFLVYRVEAGTGRLRDLDAGLFEDFFRGFSNHAAMNLHMELRYGRDTHHVVEALFKGLGRALAQAAERDERVVGVRSTKGTL